MPVRKEVLAMIENYISTISKKIEKTWKSLDTKITVNKRELVLGILLCTLIGIVIGALFSPKKRITIGSNNANGTLSCCDDDDDYDDDEDYE